MAQVSAEDVRRWLAGLQLPATPETVVAEARQRGAPPDLITSLEKMPPGEWHSLDRVVAVWERANDRVPPGMAPGDRPIGR